MGVFQNIHDPILSFSDCYRTPIYDEKNLFLGKLNDLFVDFEESYPTVLAISIKQKGKFKYIHWDEVKLFSYQKIVVSLQSQMGEGKIFPKTTKRQEIKNLLKIDREQQVTNYPGVCQAVLDKQIVDTHGKKVVRVNDIHLIKTGRMLRVTHAAIGAKSMAKRLGLERTLTYLLRILTLNTKKEIGERTISWQFVHAIAGQHLEDVKLNVSNHDLKSLHPADLADIIEELDGHSRQEIFKELDKEKAADTLAEIDRENLQAHLLEIESPENAAAIIEHMGTDEAADVLAEMTPENVEIIIDKIKDTETKEDIKELLLYERGYGRGTHVNGRFRRQTTSEKRGYPQTTEKSIMRIMKISTTFLSQISTKS